MAVAFCGPCASLHGCSAANLWSVVRSKMPASTWRAWASPVELNGRRVGDHVCDPALTNYDHRVWYVAHDVTAQLVPGVNAKPDTPGNGRFFRRAVAVPRIAATTGTQSRELVRGVRHPRLRLPQTASPAGGCLRRRGRTFASATSSWRITSDGPIRANNEYDGEEYDARQEQPGWDEPGLGRRCSWPRVSVTRAGRSSQAQMVEPIRVLDVLATVAGRAGALGPDRRSWPGHLRRLAHPRPRAAWGPSGLRGASARSPMAPPGRGHSGGPDHRCLRPRRHGRRSRGRRGFRGEGLASEVSLGAGSNSSGWRSSACWWARTAARSVSSRARTRS